MKSISLVTAVIISCLPSILSAQQCNNLLLNYFGFQHFDSPQSVHLRYCNFAQTCCSGETVALFQARADQIADKLNTYHAARDLFLIELDHIYYERVTELLQEFSNNYLNQLRQMQSTNANLADQLQAEFQSSMKAWDAASLIHTPFNSTLQDYQYTRTHCFTVAMQVRASAWCLACDPNYQNEGLNDDGSVSFSDNQCQYITDACWPYFQLGAQFNPLIELREVYWNLLVMSGYLDGENTLDYPDLYQESSTQLPVVLPKKWVIGDGNCWDLWAGDPLLVEIFTFNSATLPGGKIAEQAKIIAEHAAIIGEQEDGEQPQQNQEKKGEGEVVYNNMEFAQTVEDGLEFEFEFEGRILFDARMLFGVLDLFEGQTDPGLRYNVIQDPANYWYSLLSKPPAY